MPAKKLSTELLAFVEAHPDGWSHDDWLGLLYQLTEAGFDTADEDGIGLALERARVVRTLREMSIKGLGAKRIETVADRFGTLWNLRNASSDTMREVAGLPPTVAHEVRKGLN